MNQEIEKIDFFGILKARKEEKRREKIFNDLRDTRHFNSKKHKEVASSEDVINFFKSNTKANKLYILSSNEDYDGKEVALNELDKNEFWQPDEIIGYDIKSKKGFFVNHESWFYLLG